MKLSKVRTAEEIIARFKDGQIIAIGGQTNQYMPDRLIDCSTYLMSAASPTRVSSHSRIDMKMTLPMYLSRMPNISRDSQVAASR